MKTIVNKTHVALKVPLPHGKVLHLGLGKSGQISVHDADHPPIKKLIEEGKVVVFDERENEANPATMRRVRQPYEK